MLNSQIFILIANAPNNHLIDRRANCRYLGVAAQLEILDDPGVNQPLLAVAKMRRHVDDVDEDGNKQLHRVLREPADRHVVIIVIIIIIRNVIIITCEPTRPCDSRHSC